MNRKEALEIIKTVGPFLFVKNGILNGLNLLTSLDPELDLDSEFRAEHDQIWCCDFDKTVALMTEEQIRNMESWNWFEAEDGWSCFVSN